MSQGDQRRTLRCWIGLHTWVTRVNAGARWHECGRCGTYSRKVVTGTRFPPAGTGGDGTGGGT